MVNYWNYRVVKIQEKDNVCFAIAEVYYDDKDNPVVWVKTNEKILLYEKYEDLKGTINLISDALDEPILIAEGNKFREDVSFQDYNLEDYPEVGSVDFPEEIHIAYAVCGKTCGNREFIVDGQTQVCEYCRKQMFRTEVRKYVLDRTERRQK